jgi:ABC-type transporter Mla MlaB component
MELTMEDIEGLLRLQGEVRREVAFHLLPDSEFTVAAAKWIERKYDDGSRTLAELYRMAADLAQILDAAAQDYAIEQEAKNA